MFYKLFLLSIIAASCSSSRMIETHLYFGQTRPDGSLITDTDWNRFKETQVARVCREGSTTIRAVGNWLDPVTHTLISEPTYVLVYFYKKNAETSRQLDSLRLRYKTMFQQQSVLRVERKVKATF